jgi:hypothetical protein
MNMTYDDYIEFINYLFMQEYVDDEYHTGRESTVGSLTLL